MAGPAFNKIPLDFPGTTCPYISSSDGNQVEPSSEVAASSSLSTRLPSVVGSQTSRFKTIPVPLSAEKRNIYVDMEVATSRWTIDEFQSRFAYVTSQLKRAVDGHCDLKNRARFVSYSLRMVGKTPEQAIPSIVIGCCSSDVSRLQKLFRDSRSRLNCTSGVSSLRFLRKKEDDSFPIFKLIYYPTDSSPLTHKAADELMNVQVLSDQTL